jgi:hypothetical protein
MYAGTLELALHGLPVIVVLVQLPTTQAASNRRRLITDCLVRSVQASFSHSARP